MHRGLGLEIGSEAAQLTSTLSWLFFGRPHPDSEVATDHSCLSTVTVRDPSASCLETASPLTGPPKLHPQILLLLSR